MKTAKKPSYDLNRMKSLVQRGKFQQTVRITNYLAERYNDIRPREVTKIVISRLTELDFVKSVELSNRPGTMADIYVGSDFDDVEWYVKAFIEEDQLKVQVWSMCWDGALH